MRTPTRRAFAPRTLAAILFSALTLIRALGTAFSLRALVVMLSWALPLAAVAQTLSTAVVTGRFDGTVGYEWEPEFGTEKHITFTCTGTPTCSGQYTESVKRYYCPNTIQISGTIRITGLNLSSTGSLTGNVTLGSGWYDVNHVSGGNCTLGQYISSATLPYSGSWNSATATGSMLMRESIGELPGTFSAAVSAPPPVFPMTVRSTIDAVRATAVADIQYRPQDVGTSGSVYVFAVAPSGIVKGGQEAKALVVGEARSTIRAGEKADACVISQLNSAGQLVAVTFAQLQAYLSGTLSAAGASVSILNGTPTPNVAGATFYVGYGASSSAMVNDGVFRNAVLVPGTRVCPMMPLLTALWWNPSESGWGLNLNHQGGTLFGTLFTYDASRAPLWLVMSGGVMQPDGISYTGDLYRTTGPAFNANPFTPIGAENVTQVGTMSVSFSDANVGTLTYTVNGVSVSKVIQRQVYGTRGANCLPTSESRAGSTHYQDLWWNPAESGWGLNVTHQDNTLFATLFTYDATGRDLWLVMSEGVRQPDGSYLGTLYRTNGPAFSTLPFGGVTVADVGTMRLDFTDGNTGTLTYTYDGNPVTKNIQRQVFSSPVSTCN
jgi:hypothetical protein